MSNPNGPIPVRESRITRFIDRLFLLLCLAGIALLIFIAAGTPDGTMRRKIVVPPEMSAHVDSSSQEHDLQPPPRLIFNRPLPRQIDPRSLFVQSTPLRVLKTDTARGVADVEMVTGDTFFVYDERVVTLTPGTFFQMSYDKDGNVVYVEKVPEHKIDFSGNRYLQDDTGP